MHHLNVRVAWHDNKWDGSVCTNPSGNAFCVDLDRIRAERNDGLEDRLARKWFADLTPDQLPPCTAETGRVHELTRVGSRIRAPLSRHSEGKGHAWET